MARPKNADKAATWNRIVAAARRELFETPGGMPDVSVRSVAASAGVGAGTIQYYFPTKEGLLEACLDEYYLALDQLVRELAEIGAGASADPRAFVETAARRLYQFVVSERPQLMLRAATNAQRGALQPERQGKYFDDLSELLSPMFGISAAETRLTFQTMSFVMMQYAVLGEDDVARITGEGGEAGRRALEDHVVRVALRLVLPT
jgi:AcrR family transcriptional regulator